MKTLLILRHGKSGEKDSGIEDHERSLKERGKEDSKRMGALIKEKKIVPDLIICSTALRAKDTAERAAKACKYRGEIAYRRDVYDEGAPAYLAALRELGGVHATVMIVGHNPDLEEVLHGLTDSRSPLATCALAQIALSIDDWSELKPSLRGELLHIWNPKELG